MKVYLAILIEVVKLTITVPSASAQRDCISYCLADFINVNEGNFNVEEYFKKLQHSNIMGSSNEEHQQDFKNKIDFICRSYVNLKNCTSLCHGEKNPNGILTNGFFGLQYVCEHNYNTFLQHVPCLLKHEKEATEFCINEAYDVTNAMMAIEAAGRARDYSDLKLLLSTLCQSINEMLQCITPITEKGCGREPSELYSSLVALGFKHTEFLYGKLNLKSYLPTECILLVRRPTTSTSSIYIEKTTEGMIMDFKQRADAISKAINHCTNKLALAVEALIFIYFIFYYIM